MLAEGLLQSTKIKVPQWLPALTQVSRKKMEEGTGNSQIGAKTSRIALCGAS